jgi:hypothetical protein
LATIGGGRMGLKVSAEIEGRKSGGNEREGYFLNKDKRLIRQIMKITVSSETLLKRERM